ncbi:MAG: 50S ribosomal protein L22 [Eggerthellaceae bacterium]|nr:50S ribosomal protein L22 [Eggerthellaceae bacterium]
MEAKAIARFVRVSPRKARIVVDQIRGKSVVRAREILAFTNRGIAETVEKTLNSAVANAENQHHVRPESLVVKAAYVDEGPTLKRIRPRAKGSASRINKRTSHITVIVAPREEA